MRGTILVTALFLLCSSSLSLLIADDVVPTPPAAASRGVVNGYCTGTGSADVPCSLDAIASYSSAINSVSIASYKLSPVGVIEPCNATTSGCLWHDDVEAFNSDIVARFNHTVQVTPLVFDNDGDTVAAFRAMLAHNRTQQNIDALVAATVRHGYNGISMDWEPSCWLDAPSKCAWPTVEEAQAYAAFLARLGDAMHVKGLPLTVCADHEVCTVPCDGDAYLAHCTVDEWSMAQCNCCAFQAWFNASTLCAASSRIDVVSVMDSYANAFNERTFNRSVAPWFAAGCTAERMSLGLLQNQAATADAVKEMMAAVRALGISKVDIWSNPWRSKDVIGVWQDELRAFVNGSVTSTDITPLRQRRHQHEAGRRERSARLLRGGL